MASRGWIVPLRRYQVETVVWIILTAQCLYYHYCHQQQTVAAVAVNTSGSSGWAILTPGAASSILTLCHLLVQLVSWQSPPPTAWTGRASANGGGDSSSGFKQQQQQQQGPHSIPSNVDDDSDDTSGLVMSIALGPALLQSIQGHASQYALAMAIASAIVSGSRRRRRREKPWFSSAFIAVVIVPVGMTMAWLGVSSSVHGTMLSFDWCDNTNHPYCVDGVSLLEFWSTPSATTTSWVAAWFVVVWYLLYTGIPRWIVPTLFRVVTRGEWWLASSIGALILVETAVAVRAVRRTTTHPTMDHATEDYVYAVTAVTGVVSCAISCRLVQAIASSVSTASKRNATVVRRASQRMTETSSSTLSFPLVMAVGQLTVMIGMTLGLVEACFIFLYPSTIFLQRPFPHCLYWLFGEFLLASEVQSHPSILSATPLEADSWPRWVWLVYWGIVLCVTIPLAPHANTAHPVLARKWFHWIAVLLFVPTTVLVPQLMSLSYAIAVAVLLVLESTRHNVPWLNTFYDTYLDSSKDESSDSTIVSHLALIVGCAIPLWLSQWITANASPAILPLLDVDNAVALYAEGVVRRFLLPLWGVWSLGVGDAMGAMVGKRFGRVHWGYNRRTLEGSLALCASLGLVCHGTVAVTVWNDTSITSWSVMHQWIPAVLLVTVLEAFTLQIDNIVVPLAGAAMLLVCTRESG